MENVRLIDYCTEGGRSDIRASRFKLKLAAIRFLSLGKDAR